MSYALTEDGNAFFGKEGSGRIYIDGNQATLYSPGWEKGGMQIDLDRPHIKMTNGTYNIVLDAGANVSKPFTIGTKFSVSWNGTLRAEDG
jgi:hypothetical protein